MAEKKTDPDPQSTWGATDGYKDAWYAEHGDKARKETEKVASEPPAEEK